MFWRTLPYGGMLVVASAAVLGGASDIRGSDAGNYHRSLYQRDPYYGHYTDDYGEYPYYHPNYNPSPNPIYNTDADEPRTAFVPKDTNEAGLGIPARIAVVVPGGAKLFVDGQPTESTGTYRFFRSPPLDSGTRYWYEFTVRWNEAGKEVTQTQVVDVTAGADIDLRFPVAQNSARQAYSRLPQPRQFLAR